MRLHFVELRVSDWPASVAWYRDVLGLEVVLRDESNRFALLAAGTCRVALKDGAPAPGDVLLAFEVDELAPFEPLSDDIKASEEGYRRVLLRDPDGYSVALFEWCSSRPDHGRAESEARPSGSG